MSKESTTDNSELVPISNNVIQSLIYTVRGQQVMLDSDLAMLYQVETRRLNENVKRNIARFPESFCFQMTKEEYESLMSQIATSNTISQRGIIAPSYYLSNS